MDLEIYQALSIVEPHGRNIANGLKTLEIRSWKPEQVPLYNLLIVENKNYLRQEGDEDEGYAVAIVDVFSIDSWQEHEIEAACANEWKEGYFAWELTNVRPIQPPIKTKAKRRLYTVEL